MDLVYGLVTLRCVITSWYSVGAMPQIPTHLSYFFQVLPPGHYCVLLAFY